MNATRSSVAPPSTARPLSVELAQLQLVFADRPATLREIIEALGDRAYELMTLLFVLPFLLPVSVPGMSTPFGFAIAVVATQIALGRLPWLPQAVLDRRVPAGFLAKVIAVTRGVVRLMERLLRPRWSALTARPWLNGLHWFAICLAAVVLTLPLPIPFTNTFPGWTILLLTAGLLERDGLFVTAGYAMMVATFAFFSLLGAGAHLSLHQIAHWFGL